MATSKKFSELPAASSVGNGDLFAIAHEDALAETGYVSQKLTAAQAGQKVNGDTEYPTSLPSFPANGQNPFAALEKLNQDIIDLYPVSIASGSIATFTTSLALPLVAMSAEIVAQQASGTPTPSSPLPISGVSSVGLYHGTPKSFTIEQGSINQTTGADETSTTIKRTSYIGVSANSLVTFVYVSALSYDRTVRAFFYGQNGSSDYLGTQAINITANSLNASVVVPNNTYFIRFHGINANMPNDLSIWEYPNTKTIALGQTVYGGSVDCINGKLTITHVCEELGGLTWGSGTGGVSRFVANPTYTAKAPTAATIQADVISDIFKTVSSRTIYEGTDDYEIAIHTNGTIWVRDTDYSDKDAFKTAMANHYVCYELDTPIEITGLTGVNFTTFAGEQNIFADSGDISVSFKQGIQEYIDAKIAETQALIL